MDVSRVKLGVVVPRGGAPWWLARMLDGLWGLAPGTVALLDPAWRGLVPPLPWRALLGLERGLARALSGPGTPKPAGPSRPPGPGMASSRRVPTEPARPSRQPRPDVFATCPLAGPTALLGEAAGLGLDAVIAPAGTRLPEGLLSTLALGLWTLEPPHPDLFGDGWVESRLLLHLAGQEPRLLCNSFTSVQGPWPKSWFGPMLAKAALFPRRVLARLADAGPDHFAALPVVAPLPAFRPGPADWCAFARRLAGYGLTKAWQDLLHRRQWFLARRPGGDGPGSGPGSGLGSGLGRQPFTPMYPPKGTGWADPFVFEHEGSTFLFIEEIPPSGRGVVSVLERTQGRGEGRDWSAPRRVLEEPFHLSYPQVFAHGGEMYMVPESAEAGRVGLYRATDFPGGWVLDRELLSGVDAVDATLFLREGTWWMFVNLRAPGGSSWDELHLYRADRLEGPYTPHPWNPVVSDVRRARPGGRIFARGGKLFRPAQDCSGWYGRGLSIMEITRLDARGYEEVPAGHLGPELIPGSFCLHTLELLEALPGKRQEPGRVELELVDGQRFVSLWKRGL